VSDQPHNKGMHQTKGARSGRSATGDLKAPFAGEARCWADQEGRTLQGKLLRRSPPSVYAVGLLALVTFTACGPKKEPSAKDSARYAAEAGIEFGKDMLKHQCESPGSLVSLRSSMKSSFVPFPGHEGPVSKIYGYELPGGATATISLGPSDTSPDVLAMRALGQTSTASTTITVAVTCEQVRGRARR